MQIWWSINKPAGLAVHGGSGLTHGVIEALRAARPELGELDLVHRLDRETSGCLLIAKRRSALRDLHAQLREGRVEKRYLALVCGHWQLGHKRIELALATDERRSGERHVAVRSHGQMAVSTFRPVQFFGRLATLMEVDLGTGKTHQIRVHAAHAGFPVAGDDKYGDRERNAELRDFGLHRMFLHAASIGVTRPGTAEPLSISAPLSADLREVLDALVRAPKARSPRSTPASQISGRPVSAVGSTVSIRLDERDAERLSLEATGTVPAVDPAPRSARSPHRRELAAARWSDPCARRSARRQRRRRTPP